jgi:hypothetical protein
MNPSERVAYTRQRFDIALQRLRESKGADFLARAWVERWAVAWSAAKARLH